MPDLARKLKRLTRALYHLSTAANEEQLLERMLEVVERVFRRETAAVLLREPGEDHLRIRAAHGYEDEMVKRYRPRLGEGIAGTVAATGEPRLVAEVKNEPDYVAGVSAAVSEMAVPLIVDREVIGVLDLQSREAAFGDEDMALLAVFGEQAAWAMRHGRALAKAAERARRLELLNRAARALNSILDPDRLLTRILELANEALGVNNLAVLLVDRDGRNLQVLKALRPKGIEGMLIPIEKGVTGAVFRSGRAEVVPDVSADRRYISGGLEGTRSEMVAPLNIDDEIIGVLDAEGDNISSFGEVTVEVFEAFAAQVATALRNARLLSDLEDRARRLRMIIKSAHALNALHDSDEIIQELLASSTRALGLKRTAVLRFDRKRNDLVLHAAQGYGLAVGTRIPMGIGITGDVAKTGRAALVNDVSKDQRYVDGVQGGRAEMAVPMVVRGELLGVLDAESTELNAFSARDLDLFQAFADQAAVALFNARLFFRLETANQRLKANIDEVSRLNREISDANRSLENQIKQLTTLHQAGQAITSSLDLNETLEAILRMSGELVKSSAGAIKLMDEETKELRVMAQAGIVGGDGDAVTKYDVPLRIGERTIGVFELARIADQQLGPNEHKLLETLASQAAIAIENARLFEDTQRIYYDTLKSLAQALEARDHYTKGHSERVASLSQNIGNELGLTQEQRHLIYNSALLHDIGKIGIRDAVLLAPRALSDDEMEIIRQHPTFGNIILKPLKFLGEVSNLVKHHHERWDGTGYPDGLKGEEIPLAARIIAVADAFDAMTSNRPYRAARSQPEAIDEIEEQAGRQFDPTVVAAFKRVVEG